MREDNSHSQSSIDPRPTPRRAIGFDRAIQWPIGHPWIAIVLTLFLSFTALILVNRLHADASLAAMFPANDPSAKALTHVLEDFPAADQMIVLASLPNDAPGQDAERLIEFGHRFATAVHVSPEMERLSDGIFYRPDSQSREFVEKVVVPAAIFYLDDAGFAAARKRLTPAGIERQIALDSTLMSAPGPAADAISKMVKADPLRLHEFISDRLGHSQPFRTFENREEFVSPDGRHLLIRIIGKKPPSDLDYSRELTERVTELANAANTERLKLQFTGSYPIAARSAEAIRRDMIGSVIGSIVLLQLLFLLVYRRPFMLFALAFGPVALGILLGFAAYAIVSTALTPLTAVLGAILAGMGIDYSIQLISYYESRRAEGESAVESARQAVARMWLAVLAAWATSVVGFIAIGCSSVAALRQFSILGTLGLTGAFICAILVLPAILMLTDFRSAPIQHTRLRFGTQPLLRSLGRHRRIWIGVSVVLMLVALAAVVQSRGRILSFESDLTVMHPRPNAPIDAQYDVARAFGISPGSLAVYLQASNPTELVALSYQVQERLDSVAARSAGITGTYGLATLLPNPRVAAARAGAFSKAEVDQIVARFNRDLDANGFDPPQFEGYAKFLRTLLRSKSPPTISDLVSYRRMAETALPASAFAGKEPSEAILLVFVKDSLDQDRDRHDRTIAAVKGPLSGLNGVTVTGMSVVAADAEQTVRHELPRLILAAILIVAAYLALHFRNLIDALLSLIPAIFGMLLAAALLKALGQKLNMINLVAVPLLIGIDVDYGIFLVTLSRQKKADRNDVPSWRQLDPAFHAVIICATATFLGYISLIWTSVPAEQSLGIFAAIGIATCLFGVVFLLAPMISGRR